MNPDNLLYSKEHEWVRVDGDAATVGITSHAVEELGEVVYVELPKVGDRFDADEAFGTVESVKAVSELFMPASGEVTEINRELEDTPEHVNDDCYGKGWMIRVRLNDRSGIDALLSSEEYEEYISAANSGSEE